MLLWVAAGVRAVAAAMLIADIGASALWIAVIALGIAPIPLSRLANRFIARSGTSAETMALLADEARPRAFGCARRARDVGGLVWRAA